LICSIAAALLVMQPWMVAAQAQSVDLGSTTPSVAAPTAGVIRTAGGVRQVNAGDMLTHAELAALTQVASGGRQSVNLSALGAATSGIVNLGSDLNNNLTGLVIPQGVNALGDFSKFSGLNITGNLVNTGALYAYSTSIAATSAHINANNVLNNPGAVLSTVIPTGTFGLTNALGSLDLHVNAVNDVINHGVISSSGSLTVTAGGKVHNSGPAGNAAAGAVMSASQDLNVITNNLVNSGVLHSENSNINVVAKAANDLIISGGGDYLSGQLNISAPGASIKAALGNVTGQLNSNANAAHVAANSSTLTLGTIKMDGDPTFWNNGPITLTGDISVGEKLAILSTDSITSTGAVSLIQARGGTGQGHDIHIIAGADLTSTGTLFPGQSNQPVTVNFSVIDGGNVDFSASPNLQINANSTGTVLRAAA
jgi:hypothetical protein